jgi:hypothetical protein
MTQSNIDTLIQFAVVFITFIAGFVTLSLNERSKRIYEEYKRKEERYLELVKSLRGFYIDSYNKDMRDNFLMQINMCWLYCPDDVIQKAYKFLSMVQTGQNLSDIDKELAVGEFILATRMDLITRRPVRNTSLKPDDFRHLRAN